MIKSLGLVYPVGGRTLLLERFFRRLEMLSYHSVLWREVRWSTKVAHASSLSNPLLLIPIRREMSRHVPVEIDRLKEVEQSLPVVDRDAGLLREEPGPAASGSHLVMSEQCCG